MAIERLAEVRKLALNSSMLVAGRVLTMGLGVIELTIVVRSLGLEAYGLLQISLSYATTVSHLVDVRIWEAVVKYLGTALAKRDYALAVAVVRFCGLVDIGTGLIAFVLIRSSAAIAAGTLSPSTPSLSAHIALAAVFSLAITIEGTTTGILRALGRFRDLAVLRPLHKAAELALILTFLHRGSSINAVLYAYVFAGAIDGCLKIALVWKHFPVSLWSRAMPLTEMWPAYVEMGKFILLTNLHEAVKTINGGAETLLLGYASGPLDVGRYQTARQISVLLSRLSEPVYEAAYPQIVQLWNSKRMRDLRDLVLQISGAMLPIMAILTLGIYFLREPLTKVIVGSDAEDVSHLLVPLCLGISLYFGFLWVHPLALASGYTYIPIVARLGQTVIWVIGGLLFMPKYGSLGAAWVYFSCAFLFIITMLSWVLHLTKRIQRAPAAQLQTSLHANNR